MKVSDREAGTLISSIVVHPRRQSLSEVAQPSPVPSSILGDNRHRDVSLRFQPPLSTSPVIEPVTAGPVSTALMSREKARRAMTVMEPDMWETYTPLALVSEGEDIAPEAYFSTRDWLRHHVDKDDIVPILKRFRIPPGALRTTDIASAAAANLTNPVVSSFVAYVLAQLNSLRPTETAESTTALASDSSEDIASSNLPRTSPPASPPLSVASSSVSDRLPIFPTSSNLPRTPPPASPPLSVEIPQLVTGCQFFQLRPTASPPLLAIDSPFPPSALMEQ